MIARCGSLFVQNRDGLQVGPIDTPIPSEILDGVNESSENVPRLIRVSVTGAMQDLREPVWSSRN